jgi:hypothetical protein
MIHLGTTRMNRVPQSMSFFQGCSPWHNQSIFEPQCAFHILTETSDLWFNLLHSSLDMTHAFVMPLCSNDLTPRGRCESNVENDKSGNTKVLDSSEVEHTMGK